MARVGSLDMSFLPAHRSGNQNPNAHQPQRRDEHSAAEPQPRLTTDYTDFTDAADKGIRVIRNPWSRFFAVCEQVGLLQ